MASFTIWISITVVLLLFHCVLHSGLCATKRASEKGHNFDSSETHLFPEVSSGKNPRLLRLPGW